MSGSGGASRLVAGLAEARRRRGLTQAEVARRVGSSQARIARIEAGLVDPGVSTVEKLADALGCLVELRDRPPYRGLTAAELAVEISRRIGDPARVDRLVLQFIDDFTAAGRREKARKLRSRPPATGDPRLDAYLAALVEQLALDAGLEVPAWAVEDDRVLEPWWFPVDLPSIRPAALAESPAAFRRRGIFITEDLFRRA